MKNTILECDPMGESKRIKVSEKRQITIPIKFFNDLHIEDEVEAFVENGRLIILPVKHVENGFASEILKDLINQGYQGEELYKEFVRVQSEIRPAVERMLADVDDYAKDILNNPSKQKSVQEIFNELED